MRGGITREQAAGLLGVGDRQVLRLLAGRRGNGGIETLDHGNLRRTPASQVDDGP